MCDGPRYVYTKEDHDTYIDYEISDMHIINDKTGELGEIIVHGSVKWDGCSNWDMRPDGVQIHYCTVDDMKALHAVMEECYKDAEAQFGFEGK